MSSSSPGPSPLPRPPEYFLEHLKRLARLIRDTVVRGRRAKTPLSGVHRETGADTLYQLDAQVEPVLERYCEDWAKELPLILIAEGLAGDGKTEGVAALPKGSDPAKAAFRLIVDPIDGTRGLMYDKRSAWFLAGIAPNKGDATRLIDIQIAVQAEIPTSKQTIADLLWAVAGAGAHGLRDDLAANKHSPLLFKPSDAGTLAHGFGSIASYFPGTKVIAAELLERIVDRTVGAAGEGKALVFDDQYISTGGQLYEVMVGHDRFVADLRPLFYTIQKQEMGLCAHPYDACTALIAREAGVLVTDGLGDTLDGPMDTTTPLAWAAFANAAIREKIEPVMVEFLLEKGLG